jgi:predicted signal transduction protein with EAL and GGDEF domain
MADRLQASVEEYDPRLIHQKLGALRLGASIGYACFPSEGRDCAALIARADSGMYTNKTERKLGALVDRTLAREPDTRLTSESGPTVQSPAVPIHKAA